MAKTKLIDYLTRGNSTKTKVQVDSDDGIGKINPTHYEQIKKNIESAFYDKYTKELKFGVSDSDPIFYKVHPPTPSLDLPTFEDDILEDLSEDIDDDLPFTVDPPESSEQIKEIPAISNVTHFRNLYKTIIELNNKHPELVFGGSLSLFLLGLSNRIPHDIDLSVVNIPDTFNIKLQDNTSTETINLDLFTARIGAGRRADFKQICNNPSNPGIRVTIRQDSEFNGQQIHDGEILKGYIESFSTNPNVDFPYSVKWVNYMGNVVSSNNYRLQDLSLFVQQSPVTNYLFIQHGIQITNFLDNKPKYSTTKQIGDVKFEQFQTNINGFNVDVFKYQTIPHNIIPYDLKGTTIKLVDPTWIIKAKLSYIDNHVDNKVYGNYEEHINKHMQDLNAVAKLIGYDEEIDWGKNKECNKDSVQQSSFPF